MYKGFRKGIYKSFYTGFYKGLYKDFYNGFYKGLYKGVSASLHEGFYKGLHFSYFQHVFSYALCTRIFSQIFSSAPEIFFSLIAFR